MITFSQRDPRWQKLKLGTGSLTIGQAGCLLCSVASMLADWGVDTDPARLNEWLKGNGGYVSGNLFVYSAINALGCQFRQLIRCATTPAPIGLLQEVLRDGAGVIVQVDFTPGGEFSQHWVRLITLDSWSGHIVDPWRIHYRELRGLDTYLPATQSSASGITAAAIYSRGAVRAMTTAITEVQETQDAPARRGS